MRERTRGKYAKENAAGRQAARHFPAQWFTAYTRSPRGAGLVSPRPPGLSACRAEGRHRHPGGWCQRRGIRTTRFRRPSQMPLVVRHPSASIASRPTFVTTRTPLSSRRDRWREPCFS